MESDSTVTGGEPVSPSSATAATGESKPAGVDSTDGGKKQVKPKKGPCLIAGWLELAVGNKLFCVARQALACSLILHAV